MNFFKKLIFILSLSALQLSAKIEAQVAGCGGTYTSQSGTISSPNYPSNYSNNLNCSYYIQISPANSVDITFLSFATEQCCDYLQVICASEFLKAAPKYYGTNAPPFLSINPCSSVQLLFYTDGSVVGQGFSIRYDIGNVMQGGLGGLTMKPVNAYVRSNSAEPIVLSCASRYNQMNVYPVWSYSTDGYSFRNITTTNCTASQYYPTYFSTSIQYSTRTCNLTISPSYLISAVGFYTCTDATLNIASAMVVYLSTSFTGSLLSSETTEVVQNDQFTFGCSVRVSPATSSYLQIIPSLYIYSVEDQRLIISSNTTSSITISASPESLPSYACDINYTLSKNFPPGYATNMPEKTSLVTRSRRILYWPQDKTMLIQGDYNGRVLDNGNLSCFVPANPPATYRWTKDISGSQWEGPTLAVSNNGTYTCTASNIIRGSTYSASKSISITVIRSAMDNGQQNTPTIYQRTSPLYIVTNEPEVKLNSVALIVGVVLGAAVLLLLVLTIVAFVCPCRKKDSSTNHDLRRTNEIGQDNNVYRMTQRDTLYANPDEVGIHHAPDTGDDQNSGYEQLRKGWSRS